MMWDTLMRDVIVPLLEADTVLIAALGGEPHIYMRAATRQLRIPSIEWSIENDTVTEVFNPIDVEFEYWTYNPTDAAAIERQLRVRCHHDVRMTIGGLNLSMLYDSQFEHLYADPGVIHKSLRFRFEPVRTYASSS